MIAFLQSIPIISFRSFFFHRSKRSEQQDLDLISEPLIAVNQRLTNSPAHPRSASATLLNTSHRPIMATSPPINTHKYQEPIIGDSRSRHNAPLTSTTNRIFLRAQSNSRFQHLSQTKPNNNKSTERGRIFVHHADSRPFVLSAAIQMKPIDDCLTSHEKRRPCHRQNALRYKTTDQERPSRLSNSPLPTISRYQSIERRITPSPQLPMKSFSFDINHELNPSDISWSVREKAKLFEHKLSTGRENYV